MNCLLSAARGTRAAELMTLSADNIDPEYFMEQRRGTSEPGHSPTCLAAALGDLPKLQGRATLNRRPDFLASSQG